MVVAVARNLGTEFWCSRSTNGAMGRAAAKPPGRCGIVTCITGDTAHCIDAEAPTNAHGAFRDPGSVRSSPPSTVHSIGLTAALDRACGLDSGGEVTPSCDNEIPALTWPSRFPAGEICRSKDYSGGHVRLVREHDDLVCNTFRSNRYSRRRQELWTLAAESSSFSTPHPTRS